MIAIRLVLAAAVLSLAQPAWAQETPAAGEVSPAAEVAPAGEVAPAEAEGEATPAIPTPTLIPAGTAITLVLVDALSSRTNQIGDVFAMRLSEPIMAGEVVLVPAGAMGGGEVIDVAQSDMGGEQGKLILSGRYLEIDGQRVRIRGLRLGALGENRVDAAVGLTFVPYVGVFGGFIQGGEIDIPAGALAQARLSADVLVATANSGSEVVESSPNPQPASSGEQQ